MKKWRLHDAALAELESATAWYERTLGSDRAAELIAAVNESIARIVERPSAFALITEPRLELDLRRCVLSELPYTIVYVDHGDEIVVVAIAHTRREPGYWRSRL